MKLGKEEEKPGMMKPGSPKEEEKPGMMKPPGSHYDKSGRLEQQGGIIVTTTLALEYPGT